jgi:signal transduction histidine kinase
MPSRAIAWLKARPLADEMVISRASQLRQLSAGTLIVVAVSLAALVAVEPATFARRLITLIAVAVLIGGIELINRRGHTTAASMVLIAGMIAIVTQRAWITGGIYAPVLPLYTVFVLMGGVLLGRAGGIATVAGCVLGGAILVWGQLAGKVTPDKIFGPPFGMLLFLAMVLALALVLQTMIAGMFRVTFERAHEEIEARREAQVRLDLALQLGEIGVWEFDPASQMFDADARALNIVGVPLTGGPRVPRARWRQALHPDDVPEAKRLFDALLSGETDAMHNDARYKSVDGKINYVTTVAVAVRDDEGAVRNVVGINLDITARKRADLERVKLVHDLGERVKELRLLHATALTQQRTWESTRDLLQHVVDRFPPAWQYPEITEARITLGDLEVHTPGWRPAPWTQFATLEAVGETGRIEVVYTAERPSEYEGPFLKEERSLIDTVAEMLGNHLESRRSRQELERLVETRTEELRAARDAAQQASRAKGEFLANMSHEIRTPLNAILGYGQLLLREDGLGPEQRKKLEAIRGSGDHLLALINDILDMSKIEAGRVSLSVEPFDPRMLLAGVQSMFAALASPRGIALQFDVARDVPHALVADPGKVRQVLINLIGNAMKFTERGSVQVRATASAPAGDPVRRIVTIEVEDTGAGIGPQDLELIFTTFGQAQAGARRGGTGLGLAISRNYARLMGGDITVASALGEGSVFTFTFAGEKAGTVTPAVGVSAVDGAAAHAAAPASATGNALPAAALRAIPLDLRARLSDAARKAQPARLSELADEVAQHDETAAAFVRELTDRFLYRRLIEALIEEPKESA